MKWQISQLFGMNVYSDKAVYLGKVEDVVLDVTNKKVSSLALTNVNRDAIDTILASKDIGAFTSA